MTVANFFTDLQNRIQYLESRKQVIDLNIVNNDTPGYAAQDLSFKNRLQQSSALKTTHPNHLSSNTSGQVGGFEIVVEQDPLEVSPNGNTVSLEQEHLKMAQTADQHELMTRIYQEGLGMHRTAVGKN